MYRSGLTERWTARGGRGLTAGGETHRSTSAGREGWIVEVPAGGGVQDGGMKTAMWIKVLTNIMMSRNTRPSREHEWPRRRPVCDQHRQMVTLAGSMQRPTHRQRTRAEAVEAADGAVLLPLPRSSARVVGASYPHHRPTMRDEQKHASEGRDTHGFAPRHAAALARNRPHSRIRAFPHCSFF